MQLICASQTSKLSSSAGFTMLEILVVMVIIGILSTIGLTSFQSSQQKGRDAKRKSELKQIATSLEAYYNDTGEYPLGAGGLMQGCNGGLSCSWGAPFVDDNGTVYMVELPADPRSNYNYYYDSNGVSYQLYARLENDKDRDVPTDAQGDSQIYEGLSCGSSSCNYGISSANTTPETGRILVSE